MPPRARRQARSPARAAPIAHNPLELSTAEATAKVPIEGIIFDLDGTLIDYEGASHVALAAPLRRHGKAFPWALHAKIVGTKPEDWSRIIVEASGLDKVLPATEYAEQYFEEVAGLYSTIPAWPGTVDLLEKLLAAGFPLAIATSSPRSSFEKKMAFHPEILGKMAATVTGDEVSRGKPHPEIFLEAARRLGCEPTRCLVFEDAPAGLAAAHAAGCLAAALPDARMPTNAHRFTELAPRWLLRGGIGTFDPVDIVAVPPTRRRTTNWLRLLVLFVLFLVALTCLAHLCGLRVYTVRYRVADVLLLQLHVRIEGW